MRINDILNERGMTKYQLAKRSKVPNATLSELCSGKSRIEKCSAETLYKIAKALDVSMEYLVENAIQEKELVKTRERSYEYGLSEYLQHDLDAYKKALTSGSPVIDCLWGELYGSINAAEITDGVITPEHANY